MSTKEMELVAEPLHDALDAPLGIEILLATPGGLGQSQPRLLLLAGGIAPARVQGRGIAGQAAAQVGDPTDQALPPAVEAVVDRGQVDGVPQDVEEPREIPVVRDLGLGLDAEEAAERGIAAELGQTGLVRGVPQQGGQHGDPPEDGDRIIVPAPAACNRGALGGEPRRGWPRETGGSCPRMGYPRGWARRRGIWRP